MSYSEQELTELKETLLQPLRSRWKSLREKCESREGLIITTNLADILIELLNDCEYLADKLEEK